METPIRDFLKEYVSSGTSRFHMPGHKGRITGYEEDITEIDGADSLYEADGIIAGSEANASSLFGTAATYYSVEGSSQCIRAMLALVTGWKDKEERQLILAARNVHHSFLTACALLDLDVEWLYPENETYTLCRCDVSEMQVKEKLRSMKARPAAVYLTSPDYLGNMQDIEGISKVCHDAGIPLLVDNAHGAYLHFLNKPVHPVDLGADMCCDSAHKTLPALTGCAYIHISRNALDKEFYIRHARAALSLFGSTSPSYLALRSLDETNGILAGDFREKLAACVKAVTRTKAALEEQGWKILPGSDPLKITIDTQKAGFSGPLLSALLRQKGIECEYADPDFLVLMPSPYNSEEDLERLISAMKKVSSELSCDVKAAAELPFSRPARAMTIREAFFACREEVPADRSCERVLADAVISCPPAVPPVMCGEIIPEEAIAIFEHYGIKKVSVVSKYKL